MAKQALGRGLESLMRKPNSVSPGTSINDGKLEGNPEDHGVQMLLRGFVAERIPSNSTSLMRWQFCLSVVTFGCVVADVFLCGIGGTILLTQGERLWKWVGAMLIGTGGVSGITAWTLHTLRREIHDLQTQPDPMKVRVRIAPNETA